MSLAALETLMRYIKRLRLFSSWTRILAAALWAISATGCTQQTQSPAAEARSAPDSGPPAASVEIPEPASWNFREVGDSARAIAPRNIEGREFNQFGLAYSGAELNALAVETMSAEELQKYADMVTHAYPDAVYRAAPESCSEYNADEIDTVSLANVAYVSLQAVDPETRQRAAKCLVEVRLIWKDRKHSQ